MRDYIKKELNNISFFIKYAGFFNFMEKEDKALSQHLKKMIDKELSDVKWDKDYAKVQGKDVDDWQDISPKDQITLWKTGQPRVKNIEFKGTLNDKTFTLKMDFSDPNHSQYKYILKFEGEEKEHVRYTFPNIVKTLKSLTGDKDSDKDVLDIYKNVFVKKKKEILKKAVEEHLVKILPQKTWVTSTDNPRNNYWLRFYASDLTEEENKKLLEGLEKDNKKIPNIVLNDVKKEIEKLGYKPEQFNFSINLMDNLKNRTGFQIKMTN